MKRARDRNDASHNDSSNARIGEKASPIGGGESGLCARPGMAVGQPSYLGEARLGDEERDRAGEDTEQRGEVHQTGTVRYDGHGSEYGAPRGRRPWVARRTLAGELAHIPRTRLPCPAVSSSPMTSTPRASPCSLPSRPLPWTRFRRSRRTSCWSASTGTTPSWGAPRLASRQSCFGAPHDCAWGGVPAGASTTSRSTRLPPSPLRASTRRPATPWPSPSFSSDRSSV